MGFNNVKISKASATIVRELEERLLQPDVRHSVKHLAELLSDEFVEFGSSGCVFNKEEVMHSLPEEKDTHWSLTDFKATTLAPDAILVTYTAVKQQSGGQKSFSLRSSIWKLNEDKWQMIFHQGTPSTLNDSNSNANSIIQRD